MNKIASKTPQKSITKARNYVSIVYPESAPENWLEILEDLHVPALVSPLHNEDVNPGTSDKKKEHYHVMLMYDGPRTPDLAQADFDKFGGINCQVAVSLRGSARYFLHMDNPEKHQYNMDDIKCFSGANFAEIIALPSDKYKVIGEMIDWIEQNDIRAFCDIFAYARMNNQEWFRALCDNCTYSIEKYIKSRTWKIERSTPDTDI